MARMCASDAGFAQQNLPIGAGSQLATGGEGAPSIRTQAIDTWYSLETTTMSGPQI